MVIEKMKRVFVMLDGNNKKTVLPEIDESMTPENHRKFYAASYPELAMANVNAPTITPAGEQEYVFSTKPGERS